jgi:hypothetical protein
MDNLLKRADLAIRESRFAREEIRKNLANARMAAMHVRATLRLAHAEGERSVSLYYELASQASAGLETKLAGDERNPRSSS